MPVSLFFALLPVSSFEFSQVWRTYSHETILILWCSSRTHHWHPDTNRSHNGKHSVKFFVRKMIEQREEEDSDDSRSDSPPDLTLIPLPDSYLVKKRLSIHLERRRSSITNFLKSQLTSFSLLSQSSLSQSDPSIDDEDNIYGYVVQDLNGNAVSLEKYRGYVLLIVNVASECGLTRVNYDQLNHLHNKYHERGLRILAFPCNQFGHQEPGSSSDISRFVQKNDVLFDVFSKINVNGPHAHPLFVFLQNKLTGTITNEIKWNFTKFLVDKNGMPVNRYAPTTEPKQMEGDIEQLLNK